MKSKSLNGKWTLYYAQSGEYQIDNYSEFEKYGIAHIEASVPGNVELDLSKAGVLPEDLFMGNSLIEDVRKIETWEWWYKTEFSSDDLDGNDVCLNFEAVDCYAEYYLNGEKIGESDNALIAHKFAVGGKLKENNTLIVHIRSTFLEEYKMDDPTVFTRSAYSDHMTQQVVSRRPPHSYSWDIMPRAISAGIWRGVTLENHDEYEIKEVSFVQKFFKEGFVQLCASVITNIPPKEYAYPKKVPILTMTAKCKDSYAERSDTMMFRSHGAFVIIDRPYYWWPKNYGEQDMYEITLTITDADDGHLLCSKTLYHGIRKLELLASPTVKDGDGRFAFKINDVEIYCQGTNWVPLSPYHSMDADRYEKALSLVEDCGCNIIRCWGGNVYEDTQFYDFCDRHGILVWQDFTMACNSYPQEEWFYEKMRKEATYIVKKLRNHPCIVLWSGDNENDQLLDATRINPNFNKITRVVLREVVELNDPTTPYIASSPYYSDKAYNDGIRDDYTLVSKLLPEVHVWGARDYYKAPYYTNQTASFISETGYHGCPSAESLKKFINPDKLYPNTDNDEWNFHSTHNMCEPFRIIMMNKQIIQLLGYLPDNLEDYVTISQFSQAEAKKFFVERMRMRRPHASGIIWWNMLDGWPQISDAVVDFYFDKKLAYYWIKQSQQPFVIMLDEIDAWGSKVIASNCTLENKKGTFKIYDADTNEILAEGDFELDKNCNKVISKVPLFFSEQKLLIIEWTLSDGTHGTNHYVAGCPKFDFETIKNKWIPKIKSIIN